MNKTPSYLRVAANVSNEHFNINSVYALALEQNVDASLPLVEHFAKTQLQSDNHVLAQLYNPYTLETKTNEIPSEMYVIGYIPKVYSNINNDYVIHDVQPDVDYFTYILINDSSPTLPYLIRTNEVDRISAVIELENHQVVYGSDSISITGMYRALQPNLTVSYVMLTNNNASLHDVLQVIQDYPQYVVTNTTANTETQLVTLNTVLDSFMNVVSISNHSTIYVYIVANGFFKRISLNII